MFLIELTANFVEEPTIFWKQIFFLHLICTVPFCVIFQEQYLTLAEQILDALPARIKDDETNMNVDDINFGPPPYFPPLSVDIDEEIEDVSDYRSENINSPASTYSTTDSSCMPSPPNLSLDDDGQLDWADFFQGGLIDGTTLGGFSLLTLSGDLNSFSLKTYEIHRAVT